jgi:hypothetical protein
VTPAGEGASMAQRLYCEHTTVAGAVAVGRERFLVSGRV